MRELVKIFKKHDSQEERTRLLGLETDYLLSTLYQAMEEMNEKEKEKCIARLKEIQDELAALR